MNKKYFFVAGILIALFVIFMIVTKSPTLIKILPPSVITFESQEIIQNEIKVMVTPQKIVPSEPAKFYLHIETYEHPNILNSDVLESVLITDEKDTLIPPKLWEETQRDDYHIEGILTTRTIPASTVELRLFLYLFEDRLFTWFLK